MIVHKCKGIVHKYSLLYNLSLGLGAQLAIREYIVCIVVYIIVIVRPTRYEGLDLKFLIRYGLTLTNHNKATNSQGLCKGKH